MNEYHKITTVWKRDPETNFKTLLSGQFAEPEFQYLQNNAWAWTEKIDGTNIRVMWDGEKVSFAGKTEASQMYVPLQKKLEELFYAGALSKIFDGPACIYGEGFGARIQKGGGNYISDEVSFCAFDVMVGTIWLERKNVEDIAGKLEIQVAPIVKIGTLNEAIELARSGFNSSWGSFPAEGLVMRPTVEMKTRTGNRIITKIKTKDFKEHAKN